MPIRRSLSFKLDGASHFQTFLRFALPIAIPGIVSTGIIAFVVAWNEFIFALVLTRRHAVTAQIGIGNLQKYEGTEWRQMAAGAMRRARIRRLYSNA